MNTKKLCCLNIQRIIEKANSLEYSKSGRIKSTILRARHQLKILRDNNFQCSKCGNKENLTIDHIDGLKTKRSDYRLYNKAKCIILCEECHLKKNKKEVFKKVSKLLNIHLT